MDTLTLAVAVAAGVALVGVAGWFVIRRRSRRERDPIATALRGLEQPVETTDEQQGVELRLGSIYALADIAERAPEQRAEIFAQLTEYLRERRPRQQHADAVEPGAGNPKPPAEVQAIIDFLGRPATGPRNDPPERIDLRETDLRGADFQLLDYSGAVLRSTDLSGASFYSAQLNGADLRGATLIDADLRDAHLNGAFLFRADLRGAVLDEALLGRVDLRAVNLAGASLAGARAGSADLRQANLRDCDLSRAILERADLRGADFAGARLTGANLQGANLTETNLTTEQLAAALIDEATALPHLSAEI